jgi:arginase family enzyme
VSALRARCPDCRTTTAVALGEGYECHSCGRRFAAGLVRVPRAWGAGGEEMARAGALALPLPEVAVVEEATLAAQTAELAARLPRRPVVLGGCCCAHVGAVEGLAARGRRLAVVWVDAHGDLNTPETSPSGNEWGMPFRMILDGGAARVEDCVLVGARNLDPPEEAFIDRSGLPVGAAAIFDALAGAEAVYVAFDVDALAPGEPLVPHMPVSGGLSLAEAEAMLAEVAATTPVAGVGFTGLTDDPANAAGIERLCAALGLAGSPPLL